MHTPTFLGSLKKILIWWCVCVIEWEDSIMIESLSEGNMYEIPRPVRCKNKEKKYMQKKNNNTQDSICVDVVMSTEL